VDKQVRPRINYPADIQLLHPLPSVGDHERDQMAARLNAPFSDRWVMKGLVALIVLLDSLSTLQTCAS
jgi:hypothetical protein